MKKYNLLLLTLMLFFGFSLSSASTSQAINHVSDSEYKIYSTILREKYLTDGVKAPVIIKTTTPEPLMLPDSTTQSFSASLQKALKQYNAQTNSAKGLTAEFKVKVPVILVDKKDIDVMFEQGLSGWDAFYKKFPDSGGHTRFSNIIMTARKDQALVFVQHFCGGRCASGKSYVLLKEKGAWKIVKEETLWLS
jgi:hypothetical protein